jgi:23S rRNA pseudouridine2605 synthase
MPRKPNSPFRPPQKKSDAIEILDRPQRAPRGARREGGRDEDAQPRDPDAHLNADPRGSRAQRDGGRGRGPAGGEKDPARRPDAHKSALGLPERGERAPRGRPQGQGGGRNAPTTLSEPERLQKVLAQAGVASRREIEEWVIAGRISVNGLPASLGQKIGPGDRVKVNG